jgi:hypothetical protein
MAVRRWSSWSVLGALLVLTVAGALWSVLTAPQRPGPTIPAVALKVIGSGGPPVTVAPTPSGLAPTPSAPPAGTGGSAVLSISSTDVTVGQMLTITGTGCRPGQWATATVEPAREPLVFDDGGRLSDGEGSLVDSTGAVAGATVDGDGRWSLSAIVPMVPPGPASLTASCRPISAGGDTAVEFPYGTGRPLTVSSPYHLDIQQGTSVGAGTALAVNPSGGDCPGASTSQLTLYGENGVDEADGSTAQTPGWRWSLTVPAALAPGLYQVEVDCEYIGGGDGVVQGSYAPVTVTVS